MHELAITKSMLDIALKEAEKAGAREIRIINLVIGEVTGFVEDSVQFYFDFLSKGTPAEGAALSFTIVPIKAQCRSCARPFGLKESGWTCPYCGNSGLDIISGKELFIESIEVD